VDFFNGDFFSCSPSSVCHCLGIWHLRFSLFLAVCHMTQSHYLTEFMYVNHWRIMNSSIHNCTKLKNTTNSFQSAFKSSFTFPVIQGRSMKSSFWSLWEAKLLRNHREEKVSWLLLALSKLREVESRKWEVLEKCFSVSLIFWIMLFGNEYKYVQWGFPLRQLFVTFWRNAFLWSQWLRLSW